MNALIWTIGFLSLGMFAQTAYGSEIADESEWKQYIEHSGLSEQYAQFEKQLEQQGVGGIVPAWHLWRQGTDWEKLSESPFAAPPPEQWSAIISTLKVLRDDIVPRVGTVTVVSGFRTSQYNHRAGGAAGSRHQWFEAVDVVPVQSWQRGQLHTTLLALWSTDGPKWDFGLGLYRETRFHVDTHRYRKW